MLTNDDGIDAPGLRALYEALVEVAKMTVVAPAENQSGAGRSLTYGRLDTEGEDIDTIDLRAEKFSCIVPHRDHELGYAIEGAPCDCVVVGVNALDTRPDVVVSGCNSGTNVGAHVFTRSGTVSAAYEAACLGVPAMAVFLDKLGFADTFKTSHFERTASLAARLLEHALDTNAFADVDYFNLNAPRPGQTPETVELTKLTKSYELHATYETGQFRLTNRFWEQITGNEPADPPRTDRRVVQEGNVSLSPLKLPFEPSFTEDLTAFVDGVNPVPIGKD